VENLASPASPSTLSSEIEQSSRSDGSSRHLSDAVRHDSSVEHQTHDIERNFDRSATAAQPQRMAIGSAPILISKITHERVTSRQIPLACRPPDESRTAPHEASSRSLCVSSLFPSYRQSPSQGRRCKPSCSLSILNFPFSTSPFFSRPSLSSCLGRYKVCPAPEVSRRQPQLYFILNEPWSVAHHQQPFG
jgi:hypothetical protein